MKGPALFVAGQLDWIVPSAYVRSRYSTATQIPAIFAGICNDSANWSSVARNANAQAIPG